ncbi:MAG TPA: SPOR domain-containing protein [Gallionella sp.]|nr:SPOR domain-containing protein [Gallionella sp.]
MAKEQTNDELNLRRKARRRLIGAVALTLAVVVVLPMVLDSEPKPTGQDIDLRIPAPDKVGAFVPGVAVSEVAAALPMAASAVEAASVPLAASAVAASPVAPAEIAALPVVQAQAVAAAVKEPAPATVAKAEPPKQEQPAANKTAASPKPAEIKPTVEPKKTAETKKPEPKLADAKPVETKSADKHSGAGGYVAQIGAFASADTAKQEVARLKKWGFKAYTEKIGDKVRVRVGPYADRDKADKARKLLEKHGLHPVITTAK